MKNTDLTQHASQCISSCVEISAMRCSTISSPAVWNALSDDLKALQRERRWDKGQFSLSFRSYQIVLYNDIHSSPVKSVENVWSDSVSLCVGSTEVVNEWMLLRPSMSPRAYWSCNEVKYYNNVMLINANIDQLKNILSTISYFSFIKSSTLEGLLQ